MRGLTLELTDLIDPTEARYAAVAQEMVRSGNWLTPMLPMPEGTVPYLGKPPVHFWLTAVAYSLFEVDEWTSRLPSFLCAILTLAVLVVYGARTLSAEAGLLAAVVTLTSALFFFFSGASVVDTTLLAFVTMGCASLGLYLHSDEIKRKRQFAWIAAIAAALSFLTKGPIGPVLIGLPLLVSCLAHRDSRPLRRFPWTSALLLFLILAGPWFWLSEMANPGFLKYFFFNENIARYLIRDYGDRYGSGHVYPRGMSWVMLAIGFLPWTPFVVWQLWVRREREPFLARCRQDTQYLYLVMWAILPVLFFTFVRQLHAAYVLPSIPPLALLVADAIQKKRNSAGAVQASRIHEILFQVLGLVVIAVGCVLKPGLLEVLSATAVLGAGILVAMLSSIRKSSFLSAGMVTGAALVTSIIALTPHVNFQKSTEEALKSIVARIPEDNPTIGVTSRNTFSHYWTVRAWEEELGRPARIAPVNLQSDRSLPRHLLIEKGSRFELELARSLGFTRTHAFGRWIWLEQTNV